MRPGKLALCCGYGALYTWSNEWVSSSRSDFGDTEKDDEEIAECIGVPASKYEYYQCDE